MKQNIIPEKVCHRRKAETTKPTNTKIIVRKGETYEP